MVEKMNVLDTNDVDVYSSISLVIEDAFNTKHQSDENEEVNETTHAEYYSKVVKMFLKVHMGAINIGILYVIEVIHLVVRGLLCGYGLLNLTTTTVPGSLLYYFLWLAVPFGVWIWSTRYDYYNYHNRKMGLFTLTIVNAVVGLAAAIFRYTAPVIFLFLAGMPTNKDITPSMIGALASVVSIICCIGPSIAFLCYILKQVHNEMTKEKLLSYKVSKKIDMREDKAFAYDMSIVRNLKTGERYTIKEKDRSLHSVANGVTGTGKTSSCFTCAIADDLKQIVYNLNYQKRTIAKWLKKGKVKMKYPMSDISFNIDNFEPVKEQDRDIIEELKWKAKLAGITAMAPNASFSDEIYALSETAGIKNVHRLDPTLDATGHLKKGFIGFNPLYMSPKLSKMEWVLEVSRKAVMFADVMQAIYATSGQTNPYFASLNRNLTTTITMLVLVTYPVMNNGKQPTPEIVQLILNDFGKVKPYRNKLVEMYAKKDEKGQIIKSNARPVLSNFQVVLDVIDSSLLGSQAEKMFEHSQGLRIIINSFLTNPLINNILCSQNSIDLDEVLAKGEITLVNYALELGADSRAFGLFFLLSFINAVYRRPGKEETRIPNFFYIDEFPVLLHPSLDGCFSLFRQYRVAMFVAIQSLSQMEKMQDTAYLKDLLLGNCSHHFVFGRVAPSEMKLYQELAGTSLQLTIQDGIKESPIMSDSPSVMYDHRETVARDVNVYGSQVRERDFQEVTVVSVRDGSPIAVFFGKVSFLPKYKRIRRPTYVIELSSYTSIHPVLFNDERAEQQLQDVHEVIGTFGEVISINRTKESIGNDSIEDNNRLPAFMMQLKKAHSVNEETQTVQRLTEETEEFEVDYEDSYREDSTVGIDLDDI